MSAAPLKILVVDDEPPIRKLLRMGLTSQGYEVLDAPNGKTALELLARSPTSSSSISGCPTSTGWSCCAGSAQRNESLPIVVLSSRGDEAGKVAALDLGADDYVTKPFGMDELLARMRAALRHQLQVHGERPVFHVGDLCVDLVRRIVKVGDKEVKLSPKEYDLLRLLVQHAGKVLTHKFLLERAVGRADRHAIPARLRAPAAPQDRGRPGAPALSPDRNRHRLSAEKSRLAPSTTHGVRIRDHPVTVDNSSLDYRRSARSLSLFATALPGEIDRRHDGGENNHRQHIAARDEGHPCVETLDQASTTEQKPVAGDNHK